MMIAFEFKWLVLLSAEGAIRIIWASGTQERIINSFLICSFLKKKLDKAIFSPHLGIGFQEIFICHNNVVTRLKEQDWKKLNLEGAFYQSEWVKINSCWVILIFSLYACYCKRIRIFFNGPFSTYWTLFIPF